MTLFMRIIFVLLGLGIIVLAIAKHREAVFWMVPIGLVLVTAGIVLKDV